MQVKPLGVIRESKRRLVLLCALSFIIRLGLWLPVAHFQTLPFADEAAYFSCAVGFWNILEHTLGGSFPAEDDLRRAYHGGTWPPLHPFLLALGLLIFGNHVAVARFVVVVLSAITTPLVYLVTLKLSTRRAALVAAILHILYPSFLAYSHYLWSETTYIFLLLAAVYCAVLASEERQHRWSLCFATMSGLFLGLCGLTRAVIVPALLFIPLWLAWHAGDRYRQLIVPAVLIVSFVLTLMPWQVALTLAEKRFVPLATAGGYNLFLGNNPWVPNGLGSSFGHRPSLPLVESAIKHYAEVKGVGPDVAGRELAWQEISARPATFLLRCLHRLRMLWASDFFILRHIFHVIYPPMPGGLVVLIWGVILMSYAALLGLATWGFFFKDPPLAYKGLTVGLLIAGMVVPVMTAAVSRYNLPQLALLLPVAGHGATHICLIKQKYLRVTTLKAGMTFLVLCASVFTSLPLVVSTYLYPSSYYASFIKRVDHLVGSNTPFTDRIYLRTKSGGPSDTLSIDLLTADVQFLARGGQRELWTISPKESLYRVEVVSRHAEMPVEMLLSSKRLAQSVKIHPVGKPWRRWQPSGLADIEYMWYGGG